VHLEGSTSFGPHHLVHNALANVDTHTHMHTHEHTHTHPCAYGHLAVLHAKHVMCSNADDVKSHVYAALEENACIQRGPPA